MRLVDGYFGKCVEAKLDKMRKPRRWSVMPTDRDTLIVQAENAIGEFNFRTRDGILNTTGGYFPHLHPALGAKRFEFPAEFVALCLEACPSMDGETSRGGVTLVHTVKTIGRAA